jgi:hypothetical protein
MEDNTNTTQPSDTQSPEATPKNILFGTITYTDEPAYENFISNMNINQAIFVLVASANFAQTKGAYNILESETISTAIRTIRKNSEPEVGKEPTQETEK